MHDIKCSTLCTLYMFVVVSLLFISSCNKFCDPRELEVMDEVEYSIVRKNSKLAADGIKKLTRGTIPTEVSAME